MNAYQKQLFADLVQLANTTETFFKQAFELDGHHYWIFNYRLSSYTEFLRPNALECRGHMFEVDGNGQPIRLAALPMNKFFNLGEISKDINTLAEGLVRTGRLSQDVYERAKNHHN